MVCYCIQRSLRLNTPHKCLIFPLLNKAYFNAALHNIAMSTWWYMYIATQVKRYIWEQSHVVELYYAFQTNSKICQIMRKVNTDHTFVVYW